MTYGGVSKEVRQLAYSALGLAVLKAAPPIGHVKYRTGDTRPWIKTSTYGYSLLNSPEGKAAAEQTGLDTSQYKLDDDKEDFGGKPVAPVGAKGPFELGDLKAKMDGSIWEKYTPYNWKMVKPPDDIKERGLDGESLSVSIPPGLDVSAEPEEPVQKAGVLLLDQNGNLIMGQPTGTQKFDFFKGSIDGDEDPRSAALRELYEESGISLNPDQVAFMDVATVDGKKVAVYAAKVEISDLAPLHCDSLIDNMKYPERNGRPELSGYKSLNLDDMGQDQVFSDLYRSLKDSEKLKAAISGIRTPSPSAEPGSLNNPFPQDKSRKDIEVGGYQLRDDGVYLKTSKFTYKKVADGPGVGGRAAVEYAQEKSLPPVSKYDESAIKSAMDKAERGLPWTSLSAGEKKALLSKYSVKEGASLRKEIDIIGEVANQDTPVTITSDELKRMFSFLKGKDPDKDIKEGMGYYAYYAVDKVGNYLVKNGVIDEEMEEDDRVAKTIELMQGDEYYHLIPTLDNQKVWSGFDISRVSLNLWDKETADKIFDMYEKVIRTDEDSNFPIELRQHMGAIEKLNNRVSKGKISLYDQYSRDENIANFEQVRKDYESLKWSDQKSKISDEERILWRSLQKKAKADVELQKMEKNGDHYAFKDYKPFRNSVVSYADIPDYSKFYGDFKDKNIQLIQEIKDYFDNEGYGWNKFKDKKDIWEVSSWFSGGFPSGGSDISRVINSILSGTNGVPKEDGEDLEHYLNRVVDIGIDVRSASLISGGGVSFNYGTTKVSPESLEKMYRHIRPVKGFHWGSADSKNDTARAVAAVSGMTWRPVNKMKDGELVEYKQKINLTDIENGLSYRKYAQARLKDSKMMSREKIPRFFRGQSLDEKIVDKLANGEADTILLTGATAMTASKGVAFHYATSGWTRSVGGEGKASIVMHIDRDDVVDDCIGFWNADFSNGQKGEDSDYSSKDFMFEGVSGLDSLFIYKVYNPNTPDIDRKPYEDYLTEHRAKIKDKRDQVIKSATDAGHDIKNLSSFIEEGKLDVLIKSGSKYISYIGDEGVYEYNREFRDWYDKNKVLADEYKSTIKGVSSDVPVNVIVSYTKEINKPDNDSSYLKSYGKDIGLPIYARPTEFISSDLGLSVDFSNTERLTGLRSFIQENRELSDKLFGGELSKVMYGGRFQSLVKDTDVAIEDTVDGANIHYMGKVYPIKGLSYTDIDEISYIFYQHKKNRRRPLELFCRQGKGEKTISFDTGFEDIVEKSGRKYAASYYA
jgi:hypothetical protein